MTVERNLLLIVEYLNTIFLYNPYNPKHYVSNFSLSSFFTILSSLSQEKKKKTKTTRERERMGACASKPNVLNGDAPEDALDKEELVNKEDIVIVDDADANLTPSVCIHISTHNLYILLSIYLLF